MLIAHECMKKLNPKFAISFNKISAADVQGRARALAGMVSSGVDINTALGMTGFADDTGATPTIEIPAPEETPSV